MIILSDEASARAALYQPLDPVLREIIADHWARANSADVADQTYIVVVQPGDTEALLINALGWSPLIDPLTELRFGEPDFHPYWAWLEDRGKFWELLHPVGNSGFAFILLIEDAEGVLPDLLAMCRRYAGR